LTFNRLCDFISQKIELFITTGVRTSNPTCRRRSGKTINSEFSDRCGSDIPINWIKFLSVRTNIIIIIIIIII
jgi:hypothetical protein